MAVAAGKLPKPKLGAFQVLRTAVTRAPAKEAAKAQAALAPHLARAAMEPAPGVREAALQVRIWGRSTWGPLKRMIWRWRRTWPRQPWSLRPTCEATLQACLWCLAEGHSNPLDMSLGSAGLYKLRPSGF